MAKGTSGFFMLFFSASATMDDGRNVGRPPFTARLHHRRWKERWQRGGTSLLHMQAKARRVYAPAPCQARRDAGAAPKLLWQQLQAPCRRITRLADDRRQPRDCGATQPEQHTHLRERLSHGAERRRRRRHVGRRRERLWLGARGETGGGWGRAGADGSSKKCICSSPASRCRFGSA